MEFERDSAKRISNLEKHGIDFADASKVFENVSVTIEDSRFDYGERRFVTFGLLNESVIAVFIQNGRTVFVSSLHERRLNMNDRTISRRSETDWERIDAMADEDIDLSDCPEVTSEMFETAVVRRGLEPLEAKAQVALEIDSDVFEWFRDREEAYQLKINSLLRAYMEAHD